MRKKIYHLSFIIFHFQKFKGTKPFTLNPLPSQKGFTLLELLVVIAIISILTALVITNVVGLRQRANDGRRKADLRQIQSALEFYRADNGAYPIGNMSAVINCSGGLGQPGGPPCPKIYLTKVPNDPTSATTLYYYEGSGNQYVLASCLENSNDAEKSASIPLLAGSGTGSYTCTTSSYYVVRNP